MDHEQNPDGIWERSTDAKPAAGAPDDLADAPEHEPKPPFPDEPFACPACGQMLAASCRVCVACKQPIDPGQIFRPKPKHIPTSAFDAARVSRPLKPVSFPWPTFFAVLAIAFAVALVVQAVWGVKNGTLVMGGVCLLSSIWVSFDAYSRRVPKPFRWSLGSIVLWYVFFPWYLARRRSPQAPCPFVEAEGKPISSYWLFMLAAFVLQYALAALLTKVVPL